MKPMLAAPSDGTNLKYPLMASAKLDGVRALIINGVVMSRSLKPIPNKYIQAIIGNPMLDGFDGELIIGGDCAAKDVYQKTVSGVMERDKDQPTIKFMVFDDFHCYGDFRRRYHNLYNRRDRLPSSLLCHVFIHSHHEISGQDELLKWETRYLKDGYEGIMLRSLDGPYKHGRSTLKESYLLKVKRFTDAEAIIIGMSPLMHNTNEQTKDELGHSVRSSKKEGKVALQQLGALKVRDVKSGVEFDIGTGFTGEQRITFWHGRHDLIGKVVKYKSQPVGVKDRPRFPVFLGFRSLIDL